MLALACSACATAEEEVPDGPVRPSQYGGASGALGAVGKGGATGSGGTGGVLGASGAAGYGGTFGAAGSSGSGGASGSGGTSESGGTSGTGGSSGGASGSAGTSPDAGAGSGGSGGSGPPGASLFSDDFEAGADKWQAMPAAGWSVIVDGTKAYTQSTLDAQARFAAAGDVGWTDQIVEARVKVLAFTGSSSSYQAAVYARFNVDAHYYVALQSNGDFKIKKYSGGNNTSISSAASGIDVELNKWYTVKLEVVGTSLKAYLDGTPVLNATDSDVKSGGVALGTKNATAVFDDVKVTAP